MSTNLRNTRQARAKSKRRTWLDLAPSATKPIGLLTIWELPRDSRDRDRHRKRFVAARSPDAA